MLRTDLLSSVIKDQDYLVKSPKGGPNLVLATNAISEVTKKILPPKPIAALISLYGFKTDLQRTL